MSEGKGKLAGRAKSGSHQYDSNSGGTYDVGYPFIHFKPGEYKHRARYEQNGSGLVWSAVCAARRYRGEVKRHAHL
jgi:hypothetical protein